MFVFDLDGTLFDSSGLVNYDDPESVRACIRPNEIACARVREIVVAGQEVAYLTARTKGVEDVTVEQIRKAGLPPGRLVMQDKWEGPAHAAQLKSLSLVRLNADVYVGDQEFDQEAAARAGVPFLRADHFRAGHPFPGERIWRSNVVRALSSMGPVARDVIHENVRQLDKWGVQSHEPFEWLAILGEEVGEANKAALDALFEGAHRKPGPVLVEHLSSYRRELVQVAAVAIAAVEAHDRHAKEAARLARESAPEVAARVG